MTERGIKVKNYLLNLLNQFIPVVLGVYIGIVASNWNENRVKKAEQDEFVKNLVLEIQVNKSRLEETLAYQEAIILAARKARKELDQQKLNAEFWSAGQWELLPGWEGVKIPALENSVHQSGIMTNALSGLDFVVINTIARSYNQQEDYKLWAHKLIIDNITQLGSDVKTAEVLTKLDVWQEVMDLERELLSQYDRTILALEKLENE